jgi:hypothetical protein
LPAALRFIRALVAITWELVSKTDENRMLASPPADSHSSHSLRSVNQFYSFSGETSNVVVILLLFTERRYFWMRFNIYMGQRDMVSKCICILVFG